MKKAVKKLFAVLLAAAMVFAMAVPAFADNEENAGTIPAASKGSIEITNAAKGETYTIYRIFDLESYNGNNYSYKLNSAWENFKSDSAFTNYFNFVNGYVHENDTYNETAAKTFAKDALDYAKRNNISYVDTITPTVDGSVKFQNLDLGYYLVDTTLGALCSLTTTNPTVKITDKNTQPTIEKNILEGENKKTENSAKIGDEVQYEVVIHAKEGATNYKLTDTMTEGLTFQNDVVVTVGGNTVAASNYTVTPLADPKNGFTLEFKKEYLDAIQGDTDITVRYSAMVNENAVIGGDGNKNDAQLSYGSNSNTTHEDTTTKVYQFDLVKTDSSNQLLAGAKFKLYDALTGGNEILLVKIGDTNVYRVAKTGEVGVEIETVANEKIVVQGLAGKTYYLEETAAPEGYNKLDARQPVELANGSLSATVNGTTYVSGSIHIINQSGTVLPGTGGMGTTLFYVIGGGLMVAAVVLLVTKKRMERKG